MGAIVGGYDVVYSDIVDLLLALGFLLAFVTVVFALISLGLFAYRQLKTHSTSDA